MSDYLTPAEQARSDRYIRQAQGLEATDEQQSIERGRAIAAGLRASDEAWSRRTQEERAANALKPDLSKYDSIFVEQRGMSIDELQARRRKAGGG